MRVRTVYEATHMGLANVLLFVYKLYRYSYHRECCYEHANITHIAV